MFFILIEYICVKRSRTARAKEDKKIWKEKGTKVNFLYNMVYHSGTDDFATYNYAYNVSRVLGAEGVLEHIHLHHSSLLNTCLLFGMLGVENYGNRSMRVLEMMNRKEVLCFQASYTFTIYN